MEEQSPIKKFAISLSVFIAALAITYGVSTYLDNKTSIAPGKHKATPTSSDLVYYKSVGQVVDTTQAQVPLKLKYTVEILATQNRNEAEKLVAKLKDEGIDAFYTPLQNNTNIVYRVRQGVFDEQGQAKLAAKKLQSNGFSGKVIQLD